MKNEEFIKPIRLSQNRLAKNIRVHLNRINDTYRVCLQVCKHILVDAQTYFLYIQLQSYMSPHSYRYYQTLECLASLLKYTRFAKSYFYLIYREN